MGKRKRSRSDNDYEHILKKLKKLEEKIRGKNRWSPSPSSSDEDHRTNVVEVDIHHPSTHTPLQDINLDEIVQDPINDEIQLKEQTAENTLDNDSTEPDLDPNILEILGGDISENNSGEKIHKDISSRWQHILINGLPKETKTELIKSYSIPENCKQMKAPKLNLEIKAALSEANLKKDNYSENKQNQLASGITALGRALNTVLSDNSSSQDLLKYLSDAGRLLCDYHFRESQSRRYAIINTLNKQTRDTIKNSKLDEYLFGSELAEHLKSAKAIEKSGTELKQVYSYVTRPPPSTATTFNSSREHSAASWGFKREGDVAGGSPRDAPLHSPAAGTCSSTDGEGPPRDEQPQLLPSAISGPETLSSPTQNKIWSFMETHPLFKHSNATPTLDEQRQITTKRMYVIHNMDFVPLEEIARDPRLFQSFTEALFMLDSSLAVKLSLTFRMFANTIRGSGRQHHFHLIEDNDNGKIGGCFALTEIAHGSNAKGMRTTATYDEKEKCFIMHTPDFEAAKCWVGSMGKCATHAIVYAMLISKGKNHGLHSFVVPIRDTKTLKPFAGVTVGDIGEKIGLNGVDNGFLMFNKYRLPKEAALDKLGGVDDNGDYRTPFRDPSKRFGASLGILSGGRVHITSISTNYLQKAVVIAVRYSAVRRQFGPEGASEETPVLLYQQQQIRLLPYLAATFAMRVFCNWFGAAHVTMTINNMMGVDDDAAARGMEMHALSSCVKPVCGWTARDGIQNCRECCGGHGYLKASAIGDLRNDNDANCTYEGENSMLLQQGSNWLLGAWARRGQLAGHAPFGSLEYLRGADELLAETWRGETGEDMMQPANVVHTYKWLTAYMTKVTAEKVARLKAQGKDNYETRNESQSYNAVALSVIYGENFILKTFYDTAMAFEDAACRAVLLKLVSLYGAFSLEKHLATLYIGGYFSKDQGLLLREGIISLCAALSPEAVALADTLAPPDWCLNSVLGYADGEAYKHIQDSIMTYPGALTRPEWWRDVVHWETYVPAKL